MNCPEQKSRFILLALSPSPRNKYLSHSTSVRSINRASDENGRGLGTGQCPLLRCYLAVLMSTSASFLLMLAIITQEGVRVNGNTVFDFISS